MEGDLTWGNEYTVQYTYNVLWNCTPETYGNFIDQCHPSKLNKRIKNFIMYCTSELMMESV